MSQELLPVTANMHIELFDCDNKLKREIYTHNTVTTSGKQGIADQILTSPSLNKITYMALGTGAPASNALGAEVGRVVFDSKLRTGSVITITTTFPAGVAIGAITEAGTFDASSSGNMWMSASFGEIDKDILDTIVITWTLTIT